MMSVVSVIRYCSIFPDVAIEVFMSANSQQRNQRKLGVITVSQQILLGLHLVLNHSDASQVSLL